MNKCLINKIIEHKKAFTWVTFSASVLLLVWLPVYIDKVSLNISSDWRSVMGGLMYLAHVIVSNYEIVVFLTLLAIPMINVNRWIGKHVKNPNMALLLKVFAPVLLLVCSAYFAFIIRDDIVVTSSWKYFMTYKDFLEMWKARNLPGFVTDVTPNPEYARNRGDEIDAWLKESRTYCRYVIIDDLDGSNFNPHQINKLLVVNPYNGIDEATAEKAIQLLNNQV